MPTAVLAVFIFAYLDLRREEARALGDFTSEQAALARLAASTVEARIDGSFRDLASLAALPDAPGVKLLLRRVVGDGSTCLGAAVLDGTGSPLVEVVASPEADLARSPVLFVARASAFREARATASAVPILSAPIDAPSRRHLRFLALASGSRVVVLLVDTDRFFQDLLAGGPSQSTETRVLVLDDEQRWLQLDPATPLVGHWRADRDEIGGDVVGLLRRMTAGEQGAATLDRPAAASLGLERRSAVAGFAPIRVGDGSRWSVAVVASAMRVRDRAIIGGYRLAVAVGLAGLLVAVFGLLSHRQQRRALALAEQLRLAQATAALRERSEKIVDSIPIGVLALDAELQVRSANQFLVERGVAMSGPLAAALPRASTAEIECLDELLRHARATRQPVQRLALRMRLATADVRDVDAYAIPLEHPLPDTDCFLLLHDRTETRLLERNLARAEKLATIGTLAAGVAHEIGTPLGIISGRAEQVLALLPAGESPEALRKGLGSILTQVDKVSSTIRQLLDFARIRPIEAKAIAPAQLLATVSSLLEHRFRQARVGLTVDAPLTVQPVAGDLGQLEQVMVNLLMNAVDACSSGGAVRASAASRGDRILVEVRDDGCGIAPEHLGAVLDPFFTTKKRGQGTGLGLTIAADIVKNHGGSLEIDSLPGVGTTVRVWLPAAPPERSSEA